MSLNLSVLAFETILFFLYKVGNYYNSEWFTHPTIQGAGILTAIFSLSVFLLIIQNYHRSAAIARFQSINFFKFLRGFSISLFIIIIIFLAIPNSNPIGNIYFVAQVKDNIDLLFFALVITSQATVFISYPKPNHLKRILQMAGIFLEKFGIFILFAGLCIIKIVLFSGKIHNLVVLDDTIVYWQMAKQLFSGNLDISLLNHYPPLYPLSIVPVFLFNPRNIYTSTTILNTLLSSSAIFPIYLIARLFLDKKKSLLFSLAAASIPYHFIYPGLILSENLSFPLFFWVIYFCFSLPPSKKLRWAWDLLTGISIGLFWLTRYMTLPLVPGFLITWWLKDNDQLDRVSILPSKEKIYRTLWVLIPILVLYGAWVVPGLLQGVELKNLLGFQITSDANPAQLSYERLAFWTGLSVAYFILILAPVLSILFTNMVHRRSIKEILSSRWKISVIILSILLFITVTRHAWRAAYNGDEPSKYVGRYIIYIGILYWLTPFARAQITNFKNRKVLIATLLAAVTIFAGYEVFFYQDWFLSKDVQLFLSTDIFVPYALKWVFLMIILFNFVAFYSFTIKHAYSHYFYALLCVIILLNILSIPKAWNELMSFQNLGRQVDEMIVHIIDNPQYSDAGKGKPDFQIYVTDDLPNYPKEFEVRGFDLDNIVIKQLDADPMKEKGCRTRTLIQLSNGQQFGFINESDTCRISKSEIITEYTFINTPYILIKMK
jgi:hypothetical protein